MKQALQIHLSGLIGDILIFMPGQEDIEVRDTAAYYQSRCCCINFGIRNCVLNDLDKRCCMNKVHKIFSLKTLQDIKGKFPKILV